MIQRNSARQFLETLHLSDTSFPTGAFAYSEGLESAVTSGAVKDPGGLEDWLRFYIHGVFAPCDGPAVRLAMGNLDVARLIALDQELTAMKPAAATRAGSAAQGRQFMRTILGIHSNEELQRVSEANVVNLPVVYGMVSRTLGHDVRSALLSFAYTRLAGATSAALRLMSIGQQQAHAALNRSFGDVPDAVEAIMNAAELRPSAFTPTLDIQQMNHRYVYSRLFRS